MKKHRILSALTAIVLLCLMPFPPLHAYADTESGKIGDNITWEYTDGTLTLTGTGATYSYQDHHKSPIRYPFKKLIISEGITALGDNIFQPSGLETEEPVFPDSLKRIGDNTFKSNYFSRITLPPHLESIGSQAFANSYNITEMVFPDSVREIGEQAFSGCGELKKITLPEQNITFGKAAFQGCSRLQSAELPDAVTQIPNQMFMNCRSLRSVHIPENCVSIGTQAFSQTILEEIDIPANTKDVGGYAFQNCRYLKTINIPEGVESLGECCFDGCSAPEIHLPDSLKYIGKDCFSDKFVRTLTLPDNQELIAEENSLPENWLKTQTGFLIVGSILYQYREEAEPVEFSDPDIYVLEGRLGDDITWKYDDNTIFISGTGATYPKRTGMITQPLFVVDKIVIGEGITEIGDGALYNPQWNIREIELPDSLKRIGKNFIYSSFLKSLNLPPHLESIGASAFGILGQITELTIPDSVTEIGSGAFVDCFDLREVHLPDSLTEIPEYMFVRCNALREINIPASCTRIGDNAFTGAAFTAIDIPGSVKEIGASAFEGCLDLSDITLHEGLEKLGDRCFYNCPAKDVSIPESVKEIGADCFYQEERPSTQSAFSIEYGTEASNDIAEDTESSTEPTTYTEAVIPSPALPEPAAEAQSGKLGDNITWELKDGVLTLTGTGATDSFQSQQNSPLYAVRLDISEIVIGEGITELGSNVFTTVFFKLKSLTLPDSLRRIGSNNFTGNALEEINLPPALEYIGEHAFEASTGITELVIPDSVQEIGDYAFNAAHSVTSLTLPNHNLKLGRGTFQGFTALETVQLPDTLTEIPDNLFSTCPKMLEIQIPSSCTRIGMNAFHMTGLCEIDIPGSVREIGADAFSDCISIRSITLHEGTEILGDGCFADCCAAEIHVPESVKYIGKDCFSDTNVETLTLPTHKDLQVAEGALPENWLKSQEGFLVLGGGILYQYREHAETEAATETAPEPEPAVSLPKPAAEAQSGKLGDNITWEIKDDTLTLTGTGQTYSYDDYRDTPFYGFKTPERIIIGEGITEIGDNALCAFDRSTLVDYVKQGSTKEIVFPDSLLRIGEMNFEGYDGDQLVLPPALEYIGEEAFSSMLHVTELVIPESVKEIGACAFSSSPLLQKVKLPDTDIRLREQVFAGCWALSEIHLPDRMTEIPSSLLNGCLNLREVRIPPQVTCIGYSAFSYCGLKKIELPESVKEIKDGAFKSCSHLSEVTLNDGLEKIGKDAFRGCPIVELQIPESVTTLEESFCSSVAPDIPDQIQTLKLPTHKDLQLAENALPRTWVEAQKGFLVLGDGLLYHYTADGDSDTLTVPDSVKTIYPAAFVGLHIKTLILPDTVQEIRAKAFVDCEIDTIIFKGQVDSIAADMLSNSKVGKIQSEYYTNGQVFAMDSGIPFVPSEADQPGTPKTPDPETELLAFGNNGGVFGDTYQVSDEIKKVLLNYTLKSHIESVKESLAKPWGGSCFGLSAVTMLAQCGILPPSVLDPDAKTLHEVKPGTQAVDIINYYQMTEPYLQYLYQTNYPNERTQFQKLCRIIHCAKNYNNDGTPFVISMLTKNGGGHAVVGYGIETGSWEWNDQVYSRRIRIWDSNYEGLDDRCCIYFEPDSLHFTLPAYSIVYNMDKTTDTGCINMVYNNPADFCTYPIPSQLMKGDLNRDQQTTIADAVLFARYLAEDSELPADVYRNVFLADYNADDIFDSTDLMKLLSAITTKAA